MQEIKVVLDQLYKPNQFVSQYNLLYFNYK